MHFFFGNAVSLAHTHALVGGQRARAHASLVATAVHLRFNAHAGFAAHKQSANAFGAVGFVAGQADQIHRQVFDVNVHPPGGLGGIGVKNHAFFTAYGTQCSDVLNHANFVVHKHDRSQDGVGANGGLEYIQIHQAVGLHIQIRHIKTLALQFAAGVEHGFVLGFDRDDVLAFAFVEMCSAFEGQVVGLGGAAGPDDFAWVGTNQGGHLVASGFYRFFSFPAPSVAA